MCSPGTTGKTCQTSEWLLGRTILFPRARTLPARVDAECANGFLTLTWFGPSTFVHSVARFGVASNYCHFQPSMRARTSIVRIAERVWLRRTIRPPAACARMDSGERIASVRSIFQRSHSIEWTFWELRFHLAQSTLWMWRGREWELLGRDTVRERDWSKTKESRTFVDEDTCRSVTCKNGGTCVNSVSYHSSLSNVQSEGLNL